MIILKANRINNILGLILIAVCIGIGILAIFRKATLRKNHKTVFAQVNKYNAGGRGNAGGIWIDYTINVDGKDYSGSSRYKTNEISPLIVEEYILHKNFPAIYDPSNPSISSIMILPKDFKKYGYEFPDSLKWILPFLR